MTASPLTTDRPLTPAEQAALAAVREKPNRTVEDYADMLGRTTENYSAIAYLIFSNYVHVDMKTNALSTKG